MILKWVKASINTHFQDISDKVAFEGITVDKTDWQDWCEVRIDGPHFVENNEDNFTYNYIVNVECISTNFDDAYVLDNMAQVVADKMLLSIELKKYGEAVVEETGYWLIRSAEIGIYQFSVPHASAVKHVQVETRYKLTVKRSSL